MGPAASPQAAKRLLDLDAVTLEVLDRT